MMNISKKMIIECDKCKSRYSVSPELECVDTNSRNMGLEIYMEGICEFSCSKCGMDLYVRVNAWEYPENTLNDITYKPKNMKIIVPLEIEFVLEND